MLPNLPSIPWNLAGLGEAKLGYIPRSENKTIARLMDEGIMVQAQWQTIP
jgi:hypothetical protein